MPLNRACLGKSYPAASSLVTTEAIQNYARACNEDNPHYFDPAVPGGLIAPPMFAVVVTWIPVISALTDPELRADLLRLLHTAHEIEFLAPIRPGDQISGSAGVASIATVSGGESLVLELDATNQDGCLVNRARFTALIRGRRETALASEARNPLDTEIQRAEPVYSVVQTIDRDQTVRYAEASGDRNPIHVDATVAKMAGLPGIIVHGLCTMAFASRAIIDTVCGADSLRLKRLAVRFARPVFPGDELITTIWPTKTPRRYAFETSNAGGLVVLRDGGAEIVT